MSTRLTLRCAGTDGEVHDPRGEHDRQRGAASARISEPSPPIPPECSPSAVKLRQPDIAVGQVAAVDQRQAVAGRAGDQVEWGGAMSGLEHARGRRRIGERLGGWERLVEEDAAVIEPAQVDADCAGIDADDARHLAN